MSDGAFTPEEVVGQACDARLAVLAITDHDSIASWDLARDSAERRGLALIPGVEISATWKQEELHILGYFRDGVPQALRDFLSRALARREDRMREIVSNVRKRGVPVEYEDVRRAARGESVSRAHLAQVMVDRGHASTIGQAFDEHLGYHAGTVPLAAPSVEEALSVIDGCGGVSVWAHPAQKELEERMTLMVRWGLQGVEAYRRRTHGVRTGRLIELGDTHGLYVTAGSDWHGHGREPLSDELSFPPRRLRPFLEEFGLGHLAA